MNRIAGVLMVAAMAADWQPAAGQGFCYPFGGYGYGFRTGYAGPGLRFSVWGGGFYPPALGFPTANPYGWYSPGLGVWWPQPTVVVVPTPVPAFGFADSGIDLADFREPKPPREDVARTAAQVNDAVRRGDLLVVAPKGRGITQAGKPLPAPLPVVVGKPKPDLPPLSPAELAADYTRRATAAFQGGELGRATELFQAAITAKADVAGTYFLLAQVCTARGQYAEAVEAIRGGMRVAPNWPASTFRLTDLYGGKGDRLTADLSELTKALEVNPTDPTLLFLDGYHRWFGGDRPGAVKQFKRAAARVRDTALIDAFLRAE